MKSAQSPKRHQLKRELNCFMLGSDQWILKEENDFGGGADDNDDDNGDDDDDDGWWKE